MTSRKMFESWSVVVVVVVVVVPVVGLQIMMGIVLYILKEQHID